MEIVIRGLDKVIEKMRKAPKETIQTGVNIVRKLALFAEAEAKRQAPVDKGEGRKSIKIKYTKRGLRAEVAPESKTMIYIHEGTLKFRGNDQDFGKSRWNRMRTEWNKERTKRIVQPLHPGGIRPDKFMTRAGKVLGEKQNELVQPLIDKLLGKLN